MINTGSAMRTTIDDLTERISFLSPVTYRNAQGDILASDESIRCTVWAKVLPVNSSINDGGVERKADVHYRITIRYRDDIFPDDTISWRGKRLRMTATPYDAESRRIWTVLDCVEVVQDGAAQ